jgi:nucleoid-associated protein YgaU
VAGAALAKLKIEAFTDPRFNTPAPVPSVIVPINPAEYSRTVRVSHTDKKAMGAPGASPVFRRIEQETVSFDLVFDATGVVPAPSGVTPSNGVTDQINTLKSVALAYDGNMHSPHYLKLAWGTFVFKCRLQSLDLTYSLFAPSGVPLRAKAKVAFLGYTDEHLLQAGVKKSSPDLTHVVTVQAGDTLPLMCHRIYGNSKYYSQVADANGLTGFRGLQPGMQLIFPPLSGPA